MGKASRAKRAGSRRAWDRRGQRGSDVPGVVNAGELGVPGAVLGCPRVPVDPVPLAEFVMPTGAVLLADDELPDGVAAAVRWWCRDGCGQDHVVMWGRALPYRN